MRNVDDMHSELGDNVWCVPVKCKQIISLNASA